MSVELEMLVWVATLTLLMWIPYVLSGIINDGLVASLKWKGDEKPRFMWAERAKRAHYNAIENLIPFAAIVIVAHIANISNEATASAAMAYFWLRAIHYLFYTLGVSYIRTPAFIGSWLAQICIVYQILVN
jgi:uncharacterized MAPEG superfamily protein